MKSISAILLLSAPWASLAFLGRPFATNGRVVAAGRCGSPVSRSSIFEETAPSEAADKVLSDPPDQRSFVVASHQTPNYAQWRKEVLCLEL